MYVDCCCYCSVLVVFLGVVVFVVELCYEVVLGVGDFFDGLIVLFWFVREVVVGKGGEYEMKGVCGVVIGGCWVDEWFDDFLEFEDWVGLVVCYDEWVCFGVWWDVVKEVYVEVVDFGDELWLGVEFCFEFVLVVVVELWVLDFVYVGEWYVLVLVVDCFLFGEVIVFEMWFEVFEGGFGNVDGEWVDVGYGGFLCWCFCRLVEVVVGFNWVFSWWFCCFWECLEFWLFCVGVKGSDDIFVYSSFVVRVWMLLWCVGLRLGWCMLSVFVL